MFGNADKKLNFLSITIILNLLNLELIKTLIRKFYIHSKYGNKFIQMGRHCLQTVALLYFLLHKSLTQLPTSCSKT